MYNDFAQDCVVQKDFKTISPSIVVHFSKKGLQVLDLSTAHTYMVTYNLQIAH